MFEYWQLNEVVEYSSHLKKISTAIQGNVAVELFHLNRSKRLVIVYWKGLSVFAAVFVTNPKRITTPQFFFNHYTRIGFIPGRWTKDVIDWYVDVEFLSLPTVVRVKFTMSSSSVEIMEVSENA